MKKISAKTFNIIRIVILCAAAVALIYASYSLTDSYLGYKEDEAKYAEIEERNSTEEFKKNYQII